jgi:MoaA/NifB/PqqE/SkfB family radical SAM enzyme
MYVEKINQDKVKISACCINTLGPETDSIDFDHDLHLQSQRQLMRENKPVPGCDRCDSNTTQFSLRDSAIRHFRNTQVDINEPRLTKLDWNVDPTCNARCIQCSAHFSSAWAAEDAIYGKISAHGQISDVRITNFTRHNSVSESIDISQLTSLYFNGGEPMLSKEPLEFLKRIDQLGNISELNLSFNTNGSIRPSPEFMELAARCKSVVVNFSLDGTDTAFEYIRNPLSWQTVEQNIRWYNEQKIPAMGFNIAFVLGIYNIDIAEDTHNWFKDMSRTYKKMSAFAIQPCYGLLALDYSSAKLKQVWAKKYTGDDYVHSTIQGMLEKSPDAQSDSDWQRYLEMIDSRRKLDWTTCLPKLHEAWKNSQSL